MKKKLIITVLAVLLFITTGFGVVVMANSENG